MKTKLVDVFNKPPPEGFNNEFFESDRMMACGSIRQSIEEGTLMDFEEGQSTY